METERPITENTQPLVTWGGILNWKSIFAGLIIGYVSLMILTALGLTAWLAALVVASPRTLGSLTVGLCLWLFVALALAAYLAGRTTTGIARPATVLQGRLNGLLTGMLLLL